MAEETVVKEMLTQEMIQAGAEITRRLDEAHLEVRASLWLYIPDKKSLATYCSIACCQARWP